MFEEEKDDAITQLFRRSEPNLGEEMPSASVWERIEKRMNAQATANTEPPNTSNPSLTIQTNNKAVAPTSARIRPKFFYAAAAMLACVLSLGAVWQMFYLSPQDKILADMRANPKTDAASPTNSDLSEVLPASDAERIERYKIEDSVQALELGKGSTGESEKPSDKPQPLALDMDISPKTTTTVVKGDDNKKASDLKVSPSPNIAPAPVTNDRKAPVEVLDPNKSSKSSANSGGNLAPVIVPSNSSTNINTTTAENANSGISADDIAEERNLAVKVEQYAMPPSPQADVQRIAKADKKSIEEADDMEIAVVADSKGMSARKESSNKKEASRSKTNSVQSRATAPSRDPEMRAEGKAAKIHPRLQMFSWLVGRWSEQRVDGVSYEEWQIKNNYSIIGKGYKLKDGDKLFEENMMIFFDEKLQQIFLSISIDDHKTPTIYLLTGNESDQLTFINDQIDNGQPQKISFQRTPTGYTVVIANEKSELKIEQQSFLNHRNAVSNTRAQRNLQPAGRN